MSIKSLLEISIDSIRKYKKLIDGHTGNKEYGNDIVSSYNIIGDNIEAISEEIEEIFSNDKSYQEHFESDDIQDFISLQLNSIFDEYEILIQNKACEEKVALAYEWLFEVLLFTCDDEEIKSKITLNSNHVELLDSGLDFNNKIIEKSKVQVKVKSAGKVEELYLVVEEIVDDFLYSYIGDNENEDDLIIYPITKVFKVK
ncbi:MAG: hypothetical protein OCD02_09835 [Spirochaetaceae bacterium]